MNEAFFLVFLLDFHHYIEGNSVWVYVSALTPTCSICVYDYDALLGLQAALMSARLSQDPPGAFPDGSQNSYSSLDWLCCQALAHLQGTQTGDLAHFSLPGQRSNFWRSSECSWTSCTFTTLGIYIYFQRFSTELKYDIKNYITELCYEA